MSLCKRRLPCPWLDARAGESPLAKASVLDTFILRVRARFACARAHYKCVRTKDGCSKYYPLRCINSYLKVGLSLIKRVSPGIYIYVLGLICNESKVRRCALKNIVIPIGYCLNLFYFCGVTC